MKTKKMRLVLDVEYIPNGVSEDDLQRQLRSVVYNAIDRGGLSGETPAEVDGWKMDVMMTENPLWLNDELQFARLIAEVEANGGFSPEMMHELRDTMDLEFNEITQLIDRAQHYFDNAKETLKRRQDAEEARSHEVQKR